MKEALKKLEQIETFGYEAFLVGGAPRNAYLNLPITDFDICTNATPEELSKIFKHLDRKFEQYGSVKLKENETCYEMTTYRKELSYISHRKPNQIMYVNSLKEDLQRRDFVMNTLCMNQKGEYVDLFNARKDIDDKIIRTVGEPNHKLEEDALRILRAIRFACTLNFQLDDSLKKAIQKNKRYLKDISYERKKEELEKIFPTKKGISLLLEFGLEEELELPNLTKVKSHNLKDIWKELDVFDKYPFSKKEKAMILEKEFH